MNETYWESTLDGEGIRRPRAQAPSDARRLSLNGTWRFRLSPTAAGTGSAFVDDAFDDGDWDPMRVPAHWVLEPFTPLAGGPARSMRGTPEGPLYTNTAYPIPLDPPRVGTENPTGDYRVAFEAPADWDAAVLRFQGVDSCAKVWLNGEELGWANGSRLPFEFDAPLRPGRNVLAVRVHRWSSGTYLEDQDMWWLPGIFRDVELIERPAGAIDDHHVHADYDPATGTGTLRVDASIDAMVEIPELGIRMSAGETASMPVEPWSAESPRLYRGTLASAGETIELAVGFRRVEIVDGVLRANGRPLTFRGVNRHEHHPDRGRALDLAAMIEDVVLMKRANIDAVRTSHYPPHPDFLRLCDEYGLWVVEECDLETHGFIYAGWEGNPPADPAWRDGILRRLQRTVERDKNHPSIVVWSLANESWTGETFGAMRAWLREVDPSRPVLYERDPSYRDSDFFSLMYPSLEELERIGRREEPAPEGITPAEDERRRALPFLLVEYAHAMGNGPGSLQDYRRIMMAHDRICGGFIWEWSDHGFHRIPGDPASGVFTSEDIDYEPRGGRFTLHGLVFSDRRPTPALTEVAKAYEPLRITVDGEAVTIRNDRHDADTADLRFAWTLAVEGEEVAAADLEVPLIAAGASARVPLPAVPASGARVLTVMAALREETSWAPAGHRVAWGQEVRDAPIVRPAVGAAPDRRGDVFVLGAGTFDAATGRLRMLAGAPVDGPWVDLHRAPTENDHGQGVLNDIASIWAERGLDRMRDRVDRVEATASGLRVSGRTAPTTHPHGAVWTMTWTAEENGLRLDVDLDFVGPWADTPYLHRDIWVPRIGLRFALPGAYERVRWFGRGPGETYVDSVEGSPVGWYAATVDELQTPYPIPQENGNHVQTRWAELSGPGVPTLTVAGLPTLDFTARRWSSLDLQSARTAEELRDSGRVWLNVDHRQQGVGSASVGPALPEQYRIPRERTRWSVRLRTDGA